MKTRLMDDLKGAMKQRNTVRKNTIQMVRAQILQIEKDKHIELSNNEIIELIAKQVKVKEDSLKDFEKANRQDLIEQTNREISILKEYLPEPVTLEQIKAEAEKAYNENKYTKKEMGIFIKSLKTLLGPTADGRQISEAVKEILNNVEE